MVRLTGRLRPPPSPAPSDPPPVRPSWRSRTWCSGPTTLVLLSQATLGLLIAVVTGMLVMHMRERALTEAEHELRSEAPILADQAERAFEAVDLVQTTFMEMVLTDGIRTSEDFRQRFLGYDVHRQMTAHGAALPQLDLIGLVDAAGNFVNLSNVWPTPQVSVRDRPYFMALKADPARHTIVSDPIVNRVTHTMAVVVAHSVTSADGTFLGISFGGVLMSYFEKLYQTVVTTDDTAIALFRKDGVLLARYPHLEQGIGQSFGKTGISSRLAASGKASEVLRQKSPVDGQQRVVAGHILTQYPMVVVISTTTASILAPWRKQATYLTGAAILLEAVVAGAGLLMLRQFHSQRMLTEARAAMVTAEAELALERERQRADRALKIQHIRFGAALGSMSEALCMFDAADTLVIGNDRLATLLALPPSLIVPGITIADMLAPLAEASHLQQSDFRTLLGAMLRLKSEGRRATLVQDLADGRALAVNFAPMDDDGWLVTIEDMTEQRLIEAKIAHMAHHDALTGLANRVLFHERLNEAVARARRGERAAVLYLDLDHFKAVNDTYGHPTGDALLRDVTRRLQNAARDTDTIARLGGDEFAIVQANIGQAADSTILAMRLIEAISAPYQFDSNQVVIGISIGIALIPEDGDDPDRLMKAADMALYRSKADGRGRYCFFEPDMDAHMQQRRTLELDLRRAIAEGEFRLFYQPLMTIASRSICGFEALLRWEHPRRGMLLPADFMPAAEETGLVVPLGKWALDTACADAAHWPDHPNVAVNLSPVQLASRTLVDDVAATLAATGLAPHRLELEITETAMLEDTDTVIATLHQLRDMDVRITLDDFGTGFSSLSYLRRFPFNTVKIDRSFVAGLGQAGDCDTVVAAVIDLCGRLGMATTAEGVETEAQLRIVTAFGCTGAQGDLFGRPRPIEDVTELQATLQRTHEAIG